MIKVINKNLARKLSLIITIIVILVFLLTGVLLYNSTKARLMDNINKEISSTSKEVTNEISSIFEESDIITNQMVNNSQFEAYIEGVKNRNDIFSHPLYKPTLKTLQNIVKSSDLLTSVNITGYEANFYLTSDGNISNKSFNASSKDWYSKANSIDGVFFTEPYQDISTGKIMVSSIQSIKKGLTPIGVASANIALDTIPDIMKSNIIGDKGKNILVSSEGTYIYTDDESKIINEKATDDTILKEYIEAALNNNRGSERVTINGIKYILAYEPVELNGWAVISLINEEEILSSLSRVMLILIGLFVFACLLLIVVNYYVISKNLRPIHEATKSLEIIATGDFTETISEKHLKRDDEIGDLSRAFITLQTNLTSLLSDIDKASKEVSSSSKQVSLSSLTLSEGAATQASSIDQLSVSMEDITIQTKNAATNANKAKILSNVSLKSGENGFKQMQEMVTAMNDINTSSTNISKVIKVIDEIAFQTNILALNAAIEAARAGNEGRGFAVVAEEVRNLAVRSAEAAKETEEMIINSKEKVAHGTNIANTTAESLNEIVENIAGVTTLINEISASSNEQASSVEQIYSGISQISEVVQENSLAAKETSSASSSLSNQSELLKNNVSKFKLTIDAPLDTSEEELCNDISKNEQSIDLNSNNRFNKYFIKKTIVLPIKNKVKKVIIRLKKKFIK